MRGKRSGSEKSMEQRTRCSKDSCRHSRDWQAVTSVITSTRLQRLMLTGVEQTNFSDAIPILREFWSAWPKGAWERFRRFKV